MRFDHATTLRQRFLRFLRGRTDHRDHLPAVAVVETERTLTLTLLAGCLLVTVIAVERNDAAAEAKWRLEAAKIEQTRLRAVLASYSEGTSVRLTDAGYHCQVAGIRREWEAAVATKCEQFASLLHTARTGR